MLDIVRISSTFCSQGIKAIELALIVTEMVFECTVPNFPNFPEFPEFLSLFRISLPEFPEFVQNISAY